MTQGEGEVTVTRCENDCYYADPAKWIMYASPAGLLPEPHRLLCDQCSYDMDQRGFESYPMDTADD